MLPGCLPSPVSPIAHGPIEHRGSGAVGALWKEGAQSVLLMEKKKEANLHFYLEGCEIFPNIEHTETRSKEKTHDGRTFSAFKFGVPLLRNTEMIRALAGQRSVQLPAEKL